jgi:hypothetical protein
MKGRAPWLLYSAVVVMIISGVVSHGASFNVPPAASLSLTSAPGGVKIVYRGATNFQFLIQSCTNWEGWTLLASNVVTNSTMTFVDTQSTNRRARFYRAVSLRTPFLYRGTFSGSEQGSFILLARTNNSTVFMGVNTTSTHRRGEYATALAIDSNNVACGNYIANVSGCLRLITSNTVTGTFTNSASQTGTLSGIQKANVGLFAGGAGLYTGTISDLHSGTARILLCPDGTYAFYRTDSYTGKNDGAVTNMTLLANNGVVDTYLNGATQVHLTGSFDRQTRVFSLVIHEVDEFVTSFTLTLSELLF